MVLEYRENIIQSKMSIGIDKTALQDLPNRPNKKHTEKNYGESKD